ncbi:hypothetical protein Goari_000028 [Gossypium aridum]|uniref:Aminotransferase-like plant mobile domain-containing protein n=1 Tax=Gossypium aridum TaxID=34290 RepID=A0A7J8YPU2_GOSAI|nr:hypothetical protein [Gossypium aridum]
MVGSLVHLNNKYISVNQLQMAEDRILQSHIRNLPGPPSPLIETYLREANFLHVALVGQGCKLDPELISALVERWRPKMHTFYIPLGNQKKEQYARVYILQIIEGILMLDKSRNLVHLRWLLELIDFRGADELNWGFAVLAILYQQMCRGTKLVKIKIDGCLLLLQSSA